MKFLKTLLAASVVLASTSTVAMAADSLSNPYYTDFNLGVATSNQKKPADVSKFRDYGFGANVNVGKMLTSNFGVEGGYSYMSVGKITDNFSGQSGSVNVVNHVFDIAGKGVYNVSDALSLYGKLGPALVVTKATGSGSFSGSATSKTMALYYAAGVGYDLGNGLGADFQVSGVSNSKASISRKNAGTAMIGAGLSYKFAD